MARLRFIERCVYQQVAGDVVHEVGDVIDCRDDYASRWIRRGCAVLADEPVATTPDPAAATAEQSTPPPAKGRK